MERHTLTGVFRVTEVPCSRNLVFMNLYEYGVAWGWVPNPPLVAYLLRHLWTTFDGSVEYLAMDTEPLVLLLKGAFIYFFRATLMTSFDGSVGYFAMNTEPLVLLLIRAFYRDHLLLDCLTYVGLGFRVLCNVS